MITNVIILRREDLNRSDRGLPIEEVRASHFNLDPDPKAAILALRTSGLVLFVDHLDGNGRIKVIKNRRLPGLDSIRYQSVPDGTILPSDWFDNLVCGLLDLSSSRVVLP